MAEVEAEGGKVNVVARRHRLSESLLYNWRSAWKAAAASVRSRQPAEFLSIGVFKEADEAFPAMPADATREAGTGGIEIILTNGARICVDAFVDETALSRVLRALRGSV